MTNNLLKAWFHIRSLLCLEMNSVQELRAKVGCPASSLGLLTLSTREPISGEKTLAFSWVSFSHNLILCPITTEQYFFIFSLEIIDCVIDSCRPRQMEADCRAAAEMRMRRLRLPGCGVTVTRPQAPRPQILQPSNKLMWYTGHQ